MYYLKGLTEGMIPKQEYTASPPPPSKNDLPPHFSFIQEIRYYKNIPACEVDNYFVII